MRVGTRHPNNLFADHQGSIIAAANASGATLSVNSYDEYGIPGLGNTGRFQYTGQAWLAELGMYYYSVIEIGQQFAAFHPSLGILIEIVEMVNSQKTSAADLLKRFVAGSVEEWEFDDFISTPSGDPDIERIRLLVNSIPTRFPPFANGTYASEEGLREISRLADVLHGLH